jgi:hypothetical protein
MEGSVTTLNLGKGGGGWEGDGVGEIGRDSTDGMEFQKRGERDVK